MLKADAVPVDNNAIEYFWKRVQMYREGCWLWTGTVLSNGYGQFVVDKKRTTAHRFAWVYLFGEELPDDKMVLHRCNVRLCVSPLHIYPGDFTDNLKDQVVAGTHPLQKQNRKPGVRYGFPRKLTTDEAVTIRDLHSTGIRQSVLARQFSVSTTAVWRIVHGLSYA